ncbi:MAG: MgtC/SapB family protein [Desulfobaccales bacterium]
MITDLEIILRLILAAILGGAVGLEREVHGRPAGVRTYLLLSLGSALIMVISEYLFHKYRGGVPGVSLQVDPGRIAAQAITGIGFLGAGVIIRYKDTIRGLTTAACVWVVCAVGLTIGAGFYLFGCAVASMTVIALVGLKPLERKLRRDWYQEMTVVSVEIPGQVERIQEIIDRRGLKVVNSGLSKDLGSKEMTMTFLLRQRTVQPQRQALQEVFALEGIKRVDLK